MSMIGITDVITHSNLFKIDCRIAYANRKYHSGWMYTDVTCGFASVKLPWSARI